MVFGGILVGVIIMSIMITMAVRRKSDRMTRIAAVIALGIMVLTVIICLIIIFSDTTVQADPSKLIVGEPPETKESGNDTWIMLVLIAFLLAVFITVAIFARKEANKHLGINPNEKPVSNW